MQSTREHMCRDTGMLGRSACEPARPNSTKRKNPQRMETGRLFADQAHGIPTVRYRQPLPEVREKHGRGRMVVSPGTAVRNSSVLRFINSVTNLFSQDLVVSERIGRSA